MNCFNDKILSIKNNMINRSLPKYKGITIVGNPNILGPKQANFQLFSIQKVCCAICLFSNIYLTSLANTFIK